MVEILVVIFGAIMGGLPTLYLIWSAIATISTKVARKVKYGISMFDQVLKEKEKKEWI